MLNTSTKLEKHPKISIITTSFNQGEFIEENILSIKSQQYPNYEHIIIDGGSTDQTLSILEKHTKYIYWKSEEDRGQSHALNKGIEQSSGDIIAIINSDDLLLPNALHSIAKEFNSSPKSVAVIHGGVIIFENDKVLSRDYGYNTPTIERYLSGMSFSQPAAFIKKEALNTLDYVFDETLQVAMDYDLFSRLSINYEFQQKDSLFAKYRIHKHSKTKKISKEFVSEWKTVFWNRICELSLHDVKKELLALKWDRANSKSSYYITTTLFQLDQSLLLFYHLSYCLRYAYWNGNKKEFKELKKYINTHFEKSLIHQEKDLLSIIRKSNWLPFWVILLLRKAKRFLSLP
ncbi:MAG: glycosyltransferase family 2 protein [Cyclobacteriaceae bacterium]